MADKKVVFVAFAIEDQRQRDLLVGQSLHTATPFEFIDMSLFGLAGVWEEKSGTFAVITTAASALLRPVHHRMPVILERRHEALWLDPRMRDSETLLPLLRAYDSSLMHGYRVSDLVNDPKNDTPDCLRPAER